MSTNNYFTDSSLTASRWETISGTWSYASNTHTAGAGAALSRLAGFEAKDLVFECDVRLTNNRGAGIQLRSNGPQGYYLSLNVSDNAMCLYNLNDSEVVSILAFTVNSNPTVSANTWHRLRIIAIGDKVKAYLGNMQKPFLECTTGIHTIGGVYLKSYDNQAQFRNIKAYELNEFETSTFDSTYLTRWIPYKGDFHIESEKIAFSNISGGSDGLLIANTNDIKNFILEGDIKIDGDNNCGFFIRSNNASTLNNLCGYYVRFSIGDNDCDIQEHAGGRIVTYRSTRMNIPKSEFFHAMVRCVDNNIAVYFNNAATPTVTLDSSSYGSGKVGLISFNTKCYFDNISIKNV